MKSLVRNLAISLLVIVFGIFAYAHNKSTLQSKSALSNINTPDQLALANPAQVNENPVVNSDIENSLKIAKSNENLKLTPKESKLPTGQEIENSASGLSPHAGDPLIKGGFKILGGSNGGGSGSVVYDNSSKGSCTGSGTGGTGCTLSPPILTIPHITGSGSNRAMAIGCTVSGGSSDVEPNISTVTYAGVSLTQLVKRDANYDTYIWTLPNGVQPTVGNNNADITLASDMLNGTDILSCVVISATGVNQATTWDVADCTAAGNSATASCTLGTNSSSDMLVVFACNGTSIGTAGPGLTSRQSTNDGSGACESFGGATGVGGTTAISWAVGSDTWQILAAAFKAASSGAVGGSIKFR